MRPRRHEQIFIGYHGCSKETAEKLVNSPKVEVTFSKNKYDWLGNGFYIWENSYDRALDFINSKLERAKKNGEPDFEPVVIGVTYTLGNCLDLTTVEGLSLLKTGFEPYEKLVKNGKQVTLKNKSPKKNGDILIRDLDCFVINLVVAAWNNKYQSNPIDSARGVFWEGEDLYETAGFKTKNHIQICIKNAQCMLGFFYSILDQ